MSEPAFRKGERVQLVRLEEGFYSGMDDEDVAVLKTLLGRTWVVEGMHEQTGYVELLYPKRSGASPLRWVVVPPDWIERK